MEGLVGMLFLLFCYERIYLPHKNKKCVSKFVKAASVTVFVVFLAFLQVSGSLQYASTNLPNRNNSITEVLESIFLLTTSKELFIIPGNWHNLFPDIVMSSFLYIAVSISLWFIILVNSIIVFWREKTNRKYIVVYVGAIGWQIWMALFVYGFGHQRIFLPIIILFLFLWLAYNNTIKNNILVVIISLFVLSAGHMNIIRDVNELFCEDTTLQHYIEKHIKKNNDLFFTAYYTKGIERDLYHNYNIHFISDSENISSPDNLTNEIINKFSSECKNELLFYIITDKTYEEHIGIYQLTMLTNVGKYYIYRINKASPSY
jgi:hypothetical protein